MTQTYGRDVDLGDNFTISHVYCRLLEHLLVIQHSKRLNTSTDQKPYSFVSLVVSRPSDHLPAWEQSGWQCGQQKRRHVDGRRLMSPGRFSTVISGTVLKRMEPSWEMFAAEIWDP